MGGPDRPAGSWWSPTAPAHLIYRSDKDSSQPPASACTGSCISAWQPLVITQGPPVLLGVDESKVGTVARPAEPLRSRWPGGRLPAGGRPPDCRPQR